MKNPFMSMWLSYANTYANMMRGFWMGQMQQQQNTMMNAMLKNWTSLMSGSLPAVGHSQRQRRDSK